MTVQQKLDTSEKKKITIDYLISFQTVSVSVNKIHKFELKAPIAILSWYKDRIIVQEQSQRSHNCGKDAEPE